jgi:hypothetical protein
MAFSGVLLVALIVGVVAVVGVVVALLVADRSQRDRGEGS